MVDFPRENAQDYFCSTLVSYRHQNVEHYSCGCSHGGKKVLRDVSSVSSLDEVHTTLLSPAYLATITVLVVNVLVLRLVHHSLLKIGAFLMARQVLEKKAPVRISEIWFEHFTGRT